MSPTQSGILQLPKVMSSRTYGSPPARAQAARGLSSFATSTSPELSIRSPSRSREAPLGEDVVSKFDGLSSPASENLFRDYGFTPDMLRSPSSESVTPRMSTGEGILSDFDCMSLPESEDLYRDYGMTLQMLGSNTLTRTPARPNLAYNDDRSDTIRTNKLSVGGVCVAKPSAGHRLPSFRSQQRRQGAWATPRSLAPTAFVLL